MLAFHDLWEMALKHKGGRQEEDRLSQVLLAPPLAHREVVAG